MLRFMRHLVIALALLFPLMPPAQQAQAQQPDREAIAEAEKLFDIMRLDQTMKAIMPLIMQQLNQLMVTQNPAVKDDLEKLAPALMQVFTESLPAFRAEMAKVYARKFTAADLRQLSAFMGTPVGQKFVAEQGALAQEGMAIGQKWGQLVAPRAVEMLRQELRKKGHNI